MVVRKKMSSIQNMCLLFPRGAKKTKISFSCLINGGTRNLITLVPRGFFRTRMNILLDLLCKTDLQRKEICTSDWLKPPISTLLTHAFFRFFMFCIPDLG